MSRPDDRAAPNLQFRPLVPIFDECRRIDHGNGHLVNISWIARRIQHAFASGEPHRDLHQIKVRVRELAKLMDQGQIAAYRRYAAQLSLYDCDEPLIVIYDGRTAPKEVDAGRCEILNGKARVVRALRRNIALPVILISTTRARSWGIAPFSKNLGIPGARSDQLDLDRRAHRQRTGSALLPRGSSPGDAIVSRRVSIARGRHKGLVTHPFGYGLVLAGSAKLRRDAWQLLTSRAIQPRGLINLIPHPDKPRGFLPEVQEACLYILLGKLLREGVTIDLGRETMRQLLGIESCAEYLAYQLSEIDKILGDMAKKARAALREAPPPWCDPLSERLLLFGATRDGRVEPPEQRDAVLQEHKRELLDWTLRALFRAIHWRRGSKSILRYNHSGEFLVPNKLDRTKETRDVPRLHHDVMGSQSAQAVTDLELEPLLMLAMHARFNPFLIWHDMRWAVPLGHWAMAIADIDAGRDTHVTVWMAELYEEQRRRQFKPKNHFTGPTTMMVHWLHWVCEDVDDFSRHIAEICESVIQGFPERSGQLVQVDASQDETKTLVSHRLSYQEDWALQATLFA
ncbi:MAG: hypothetical protein Q8R85_06975 [Bosea sp. (in: a-proteobacteria)]|uniref:hypothetical protein n=1 Tax=Bosea sp. (in: a-proteobacteria) TaxID=1871050 RepID=UPI002736A46B|nr:hypothetical protein [Bosea sp. (in: a-proteobacteria)]MDP3600889.1 hypothetical protein [Bosea sp. (in: a-proteobacteria)]